ncbi:MAG TPA: hypothetical protein VHO66_08945 [Ruminiclostridium sp.]|nr:hypothetical protein [Ruminiclostridium sp.]
MQDQDMTSVAGNDKKKSTKATAGFVLGLVSIVAWLLPILGYPVTILGIIFSALGMKSSKKKFAVIGLILSIVFLIVTLINSIVGSILNLQKAGLL